MYQCLSYETQDGVATITLNTGLPTNKIHTDSMTELIDALKKAVAGNNKVVVLKGQPNIFCGGGSIGDFRALTGPQINDFGILLQDMILTMKQLPIPIVAAVAGDAKGGGFSLLEACDLAVCVEDAEFAIPEIQGGFCPAVALVSVDHAFGHGVAKSMAMTGESINAETARSYGLVQKVVLHDELDEAVNELVEQILSGNPTAYKVTKEIAFKMSEHNLRNSFTVAIGKLVEFLSSYDARETLTAIQDERYAKYIGK